MSPIHITLPFIAPNKDFLAGIRYQLRNRLPRLVITSVLRLSATSSSSFRHFDFEFPGGDRCVGLHGDPPMVTDYGHIVADHRDPGQNRTVPAVTRSAEIDPLKLS